MCFEEVLAVDFEERFELGSADGGFELLAFFCGGRGLSWSHWDYYSARTCKLNN